MAHSNRPAWLSIHEQAIKNNQEHYTDPETGYLVFTSLYHQNRGYCCESVCRHCPFGLSPT
ncbi:MAG: DUF5522 domain-containing protein [Cyanobacteria bacterium P01_H01_bin.74]